MSINLLKDFFDVSVTLEKVTSSHSNGYPKIGHGSTSAYSAKVEQFSEEIKTELGHIVRGQYKVFLYSSTGWSTSSIPRTQDKINLPDGFTPKSPPIHKVQQVRDENGLHHVILWL